MRNTTRTSSASAALPFTSQLKSKVGNILAKATTLRINLNIDDAPIALRAQTHPSHAQTSRLLFTSLSLGTLLTGCA